MSRYCSRHDYTMLNKINMVYFFNNNKPLREPTFWWEKWITQEINKQGPY